MSEWEDSNTYTTLEVAATTEAVAAGETGEVEATIRWEITSSEIGPVPALLLLVVTLVGGAAWAGVALLRAPVLDQGVHISIMKLWQIITIKGVSAYPESRLRRGQERQEGDRSNGLHDESWLSTSDKVGRRERIDTERGSKMSCEPFLWQTENQQQSERVMRANPRSRWYWRYGNEWDKEWNPWASVWVCLVSEPGGECWREGIYKESQKGKQEAITKKGNNEEPNFLREVPGGRLLPFN
jgi:hypothetical protein